jgi:cob(I)alamin adenosyltransferase
MHNLRKGYVHLYTGNGKGKTTAALGLALRAAGAGLNVFIAQFAKGIETGEIKALRKFPRLITVKQFGTRSLIKRNPSKIDCTLAARGLAAVEKIVDAGNFDVIILDEMCMACHFNLVSTERVCAMVNNRPAHVEMVITGRNAPRALVEAADLVTEMKEIKHYFLRGVRARNGIEY